MNTPVTYRSEAFAEDLCGSADEDLAHDTPADPPLRALPWLTLAVALVGGSALTMMFAPL